MRYQHRRSITAFVLFFILIAVPFTAGAQQEDSQIPLLLSTGLPATETQEELLPQGAVMYLRANNLQILLENIDSLLTTFVPEKALPPELQPIFANPQPLLALLGMQVFGQPVDLNNISNLIGIALERPVSLALYPMNPEKGFVLSVPIAHPTVITGIVQSILMPEKIEKGAVGEIGYYRVVPFNPALPREIYILASDNTVFFCGSLNVVQMLVNAGNMGTINDDPVIAKGITKYGDRDLTLVVSPQFLKPQLPFLQQQAAPVLVPLFQKVREEVQQIPPAERLMIDARLRLEFGINGLEQLVDYAEAYSAGIYRVLLGKIVEVLTNLDGLALAMNVEEKFQSLALTLFSQDIQAEDFTQVLPMDAIKQALNELPGEKSPMIAVGQTPEARASTLVTNILNTIEEELTDNGLPTDTFLVYKEYYLTKQHFSSLESKTPWTLKTLVGIAEKPILANLVPCGDF